MVDEVELEDAALVNKTRKFPICFFCLGGETFARGTNPRLCSITDNVVVRRWCDTAAMRQ